MEEKDEIRIYVACLKSYNNGTLHGAWIDATQGKNGILSDVEAMLEQSPEEDAEEWAIHDYEGFGSIDLYEYASFETVANYVEFIEEYGDLGVALIGYYSDFEDAQAAMSNYYVGEYDSLEDYAQELTEETTDIPEGLRLYIDYEKMAADMEINDLITFEIGSSVHVFHQH